MCGGANAGDARYCSRCGALLVSVTPARVSARKVVTVLFSDVRGFTELGEHLDPESLHELIGRWFYETHHVIARHGGTVEKYMGDAVMAVFGVPVVHEDDALRAARAALEMRRTLDESQPGACAALGSPARSANGRQHGRGRRRRNALAEHRLRSATRSTSPSVSRTRPRPVRSCIGEETARLVRANAQLAPMNALTVKGKSAPVPAWRLVSISPGTLEAPDRAMTPFVGSEAELRLLRETFDEVVATLEPRLVTLLGPAGIGKSRLVGRSAPILSTSQRRSSGGVCPMETGSPTGRSRRSRGSWPGPQASHRSPRPPAAEHQAMSPSWLPREWPGPQASCPGA